MDAVLMFCVTYVVLNGDQKDMMFERVMRSKMPVGFIEVIFNYPGRESVEFSRVVRVVKL
jgi:hypothetical protein